jgi:hypothetical protein
LAPEAIAEVEIEVHELIAREWLIISGIVLPVPAQFGPAKKPGPVIKQGKHIHLMEISPQLPI